MNKLLILAMGLFLANTTYATDWYLGQWTVTEHKFGAISAMGEQEARAMHGSEATYDTDSVTYQDETCQDPVYKNKVLSMVEFYSSYRTTLETLGIEGERVNILKVDCQPSLTMPGSIIKMSDTEGYWYWDGVFFKIEKI